MSTALLDDLRELDEACEAREFCWSIGRTRIARHECRVWPRDQTKTRPIVIKDGLSFEVSIRSALVTIAGGEA
jgi:hypothetical protein